MPKITDIRFKPDTKRHWIYVDHRYCTSVRDRTFPALGLSVGQDIECEEIRRREKFHWKDTYGPQSWEKEKVRLQAVKSLIEGKFRDLTVTIQGFGADSADYIPEHPPESGKPDLLVTGKTSGQVYCSVEVSGTEFKRGNDIWVRPDKLEYAQRHPSEAVWVCLHFAKPRQAFVFIRPSLERVYTATDIRIGNSVEKYVVFTGAESELKTVDEFFEFIISRRPFANS